MKIIIIIIIIFSEVCENRTELNGSVVRIKF